MKHSKSNNKQRSFLLIFLLVLSAYFWGCEAPIPPRWQTVSVRNLYTIDLPYPLKATNEMHEGAALQYYDPEGEMYVICMEELKDNIKAVRSGVKMDDYYKMVEDTITARASYKRFIQGKKLKRKGFSIKEGDYEVVTDLLGVEYHLLYRIAVIESSQYFFQVVLYSPYTDSCNIFDTYDTITRSFILKDELKNNT